MAYETELANVENYYADLLILQYRNKPKARATIKMLVDICMGDGLVFELNDCLNIDKAEGKQLDLIGQILVCPRNIYGLNQNINFFSFEKTNAYGFSDKEALSEGYWKNYYNSIGSAYVLEDTDYRKLLKFKAALNVMRGSMLGMDKALMSGLGYDVTIKNNKNLSITYQIMSNNLAIQAALILGYFKAPQGVSIDFDYQYEWTKQIVNSNNWNDVIYFDNKFITVGDGGYIATSTDGVTWTTTNLLTTTNYNIAAGSNVYVLNKGNAVFTSQNLSNWTPGNIASVNAAIRSICFANNIFYGCTSINGLICSSANFGSTWTRYKTLNTGALYKIKNVAGAVVAVGANGYIANIFTTPVKVGNFDWVDIAFGNGIFVAVSYNGYVTTSSNLKNWSEPKQINTNSLNSITYTGNKFVTVGTNGYVTTSHDGVNWVTPYQADNSSLTAVVANSSLTVAVGQSGSTIHQTN